MLIGGFLRSPQCQSHLHQNSVGKEKVNRLWEEGRLVFTGEGQRDAPLVRWTVEQRPNIPDSVAYLRLLFAMAGRSIYRSWINSSRDRMPDPFDHSGERTEHRAAVTPFSVVP